MKKSLLFIMLAGVLASCSDSLPEGSETISVGDVSWNMIRVEPGEFTMGATSEQKDADFFKERPAHHVTLTKSFLLGETEVTQELWQAVMGNNPSLYKGNGEEKNLPVTNVSWDDCQKFIAKLNSMTGRHFRLPTEAEWEYAARGGVHSKLNTTVYAGAEKVDVVAYYNQNSGKHPHPVALLMPNKLSLRDMSGNVAEWVQDEYTEYRDSAMTDPVLTVKADSAHTTLVRDANWNGTVCHVIRGGHFLSKASDCRTSSRDYNTPTYSQTNLGLRLAE